MKKTVFFKIFSTVSIMTMVFAMVPFQAAHAGGTENVVGYAFSDMPDGSDQNKPCTGIDGSDTNPEHCGRGLGWISLNNINNRWAVDYGVNLNRATGNFEGYGYADNGGLVIFNPTGPFPSGPETTATAAHVDKTCLDDITRACAVTGWIRFISAKDEDDNTAGWQGWDGWVSLSGTGYGLELDKPDTNGVRKFLAGSNHYAWGSWIVGWVDFSYASVIQDMCLDMDGIQTSVPAGRERDVFGNCPLKRDECPTTVVTNPNHPKYNQNDPKTVDVQSQDDIANMGYSVKPPLPAAGAKCGIFDCTIKGYPQYNAGATISDNSLCQCPAGTSFNGTRCVPPPPGSDVCPTTKFSLPGDPRNGTNDPQTTDNNQSSVPSGYSVKPPLPDTNAKCAIWGCIDPYANNINSSTTIHDSSLCTYDPGPHEICWNKVDDDLDGQVDEGCPVKGPKQPVYCETGGRNCTTGTPAQP